ncbi:MAG TPA: RNA methyltransferase [Microbacteriaceae bacterium]|nr:RNA methyltransferase [Microbacteriaceae bacterium]
MNVVPIDSLDRPELDAYRHLTDVALRSRTEPEDGLYLAESAKVIERSVRAGHAPISIITEPRWLGTLERALEHHPDVPVFVADPVLLEELTGFHVHRGAIGAIRRPVLPSLEAILAEARRVVVLDGVVDHTNVGAAFRAVAGIGADAVLVTESSADPLYRRSVRVSMGTVLQVPWTRIGRWHDAGPRLHEAGFHIAALALSDTAVDLDAFAAQTHPKLAIVFGSEGHGLDAEALAAADTVVTIPMSHGVDSLNVASACAVTVWALRYRSVES